MKLPKHMRIRENIKVTAFIFLLFIYNAAIAAEKESDSLSALLVLSLEQLSKIKVVSTTLTPKSQRTAPAAVTLFTREEIRRIGVDYLHELMNLVPGFQAYRQAESSNEYFYSVRGHRTGTSSREVLIRIDGQRFNRESDNAVGVPMISLKNVAKVEFIRGPGSAIYGSNAFMGVVNVTTVTNMNSISISAAQHQTFSSSILASSNRNEIKSDVYAAVINDRGQLMSVQDTTSPNNQYTSTHDPFSATDFTLKVHDKSSEFNVIEMQRRASDFFVLERNGEDSVSTLNEFSSLSYSRSFLFSETFDAQSSIRYRKNVYSPISYSSIYLLKPDLVDRNSEVELNANWHPISAYSVQFGLEKRLSKSDTVFAQGDLGDLILIDAKTRVISGTYAQVQYQLTNVADLTMGIRRDEYSQIGTAVSPRVGITYQLNSMQSLKLLYGEAFRSPTIVELASTNNNTLVGNPFLKPEIVKTSELQWGGYFGKSTLEITLFNNYLKDQIGQTEINSRRTFVNYPGSDSSNGIELEYLADLSQALQVRASISRILNSEVLDFRQADQLASMIVNYHQNQWNFSFAVHYAGARSMSVNESTKTLNSYWLSDSKFLYYFSKELNIYWQIKNLFNADYRTPTQGDLLHEGVPNRHRELSLGTEWTW